MQEFLDHFFFTVENFRITLEILIALGAYIIKLRDYVKTKKKSNNLLHL